MSETNVVVVGAGPAGWAVAAALGARGVRVTLIAPSPEAPFLNGYGVWIDEVTDIAPVEIVRRSWPSVAFVVDDNRSYRFERPYGRIDNQALRRVLVERGGPMVTTKAGEVSAVEAREAGFQVRLSDGTALEASLVIDASGHESRLIEQQAGPAPGWQVAFGLLLDAEGPSALFDPSQATLMDFRPAVDPQVEAEQPSFLYVLPEGNGRIFVEETSLVGRPPVPIDLLERRLHDRLRKLGVRIRSVLETERCFIPMGGPPPPEPQPVVAFGGAARMVHPASGYLLARILRTADPLAEAVQSGLARGDTPAQLSARAWEAVWPLSARAAHELQRFGSEILLDLDGDRLRSFFDAFFRLPLESWRQYMAASGRAAHVRSAMLGVFARSSWTLRRQLIGAGLGPQGRILRSALWTK